jgi:hypothetical protein
MAEAVAVVADPVAVAAAVAAAGPAVEAAAAVVVEAADPEEADKPGCQSDIMKNPANLMLLSGFF